jgi:RHS repeat-associated protein
VRSYDYTGNGLERLGTARKTTATPTAPYRAYVTDAAGSVEGLEDDQGNRLGPAYSYDPYGAELPTAPLAADAQANPFRFEGHYYDAESKLYDLRARTYLPEIARFLGEDRYEDPLADQALETDALTQDRYAFAGGNPVDNIEFDGHEPIGSFNPRGEQRMRDSRGRGLRGRSEAGQRAARECGCNTYSQPPDDMPATSSSYTTQRMFSEHDPPPRPPDAGRMGLVHAPTMRNGMPLHYSFFEDEAFRSRGKLPPAHFSDPDAALDWATTLFPFGGPAKAGVIAGRGAVRSATRGADDLTSAARQVPEVVFSRSRAPEIARNFDEAVQKGASTTLNRIENRAAIRANRREALRGQPAPRAGQSLDEYPFACTAQGGAGACVRAVPVAEQSYQGGVLSRFFRIHNILEGDPFRVRFEP